MATMRASAVAIVLSLALQTAAFTIRGNTAISRRHGALKANDGLLSWQESFEKVLNPFTPIGEKQVLLQDLVARREDVVRDVADAVSSGRPEDLLAEGTELKRAATGAQAVQRQISDDILPSLIEDAPGIISSLLQAGPRLATRAMESTQTNNAQLPALDELPGLLLTEARNVFSSTPIGLETPPYQVVLSGDGFEVRDYAGYAIAATGMDVREESPSGIYQGGTFSSDSDDAPSDGADDSFWTRGGNPSSSSFDTVLGSVESNEVTTVLNSGEGFQRLAGYLFGDNSQSKGMAMTMPVITSYSGKKPLRMAFVLPSDKAVSGSGPWGDSADGQEEGSAADARAAAAPTPNSPRVYVSAKPSSRVAVREFSGFATEGEVARQLLELKAALYKAGLAPQESSDGQDCYQVYQYNSPLTIPIFRRNEIAIRLQSEADSKAECKEGVGSTESEEEEWANNTAEENGMPSD